MTSRQWGPIDPNPPPLLLASGSPRRRELLARLGVRFTIHSPDIDERPQPDEDPVAYVERLARLKARVVSTMWARKPDQIVLAADTTVALGGRIYGKPENRAEAEEILAALAGKRHEVLTAVALKNQDWIEVALSTSEVTLKALSRDDIAQYVASGESDDKAGAYGIQGRAARFVVEIRGSYSGIMGLPLFETGQLIDRRLDRSR